jgi:MoxR-like ATPase
MLATTAAKLLNAKTYTYLMTRFTTFDELLGPIDIIGLQNNELRRRWTQIVSSDIVFLDEVFKANSAILNSLLSIMQERTIYDPMTGEPIGTRLWTLIGASNEVPIDEELQALYDRFAIRIFVNYLDDDNKILAALRARWQMHREVQPIATMDDVKALHEFATALLQKGKTKIGEILQLFHVNAVPFVRTLRSKGIILSDRTVISRLPMLFAATLALYGITPENLSGAIYDLLPLTARSPQEASEIRKAIDEALGEVAELTRRIEQAKTLIRADKYDEALKLLKEVATYDVSRLRSKPWLKPRVEALVKLAQDYIQKIQEHMERMRALKESL